MVSLKIMATITYTNGAHTISYNKVANDKAYQIFWDIIWFLRAQWRIGNGWNGGDEGWVG